MLAARCCEDRAGDDPNGWLRALRAARAAHRIFDTHPGLSPDALAWLRRFAMGRRRAATISSRIALHKSAAGAPPSGDAPMPALLTQPFVSPSGRCIVANLDSPGLVHDAGVALEN